MITKDKIAHIYDTYNKELYYYILKFIRHEETAQDILQDCFEKIISYIIDHDELIENARAFLYRTAHNLCINHINRSKIIKFTEIEDRTLASSPTSNHVESIERAELMNKILHLLDSFDPLLKSIFLMNKEMGMKYDDIALNVGMSSRSVRRKITKTLELIKESLKSEGFL